MSIHLLKGGRKKYKKKVNYYYSLKKITFMMFSIKQTKFAKFTREM